MQETQDTQLRSLDQEDPPEKEMAPHSSILAWKNPMDGGAWQATVHGVTKDLAMTKQLNKSNRLKRPYLILLIH